MNLNCLSLLPQKQTWSIKAAMSQGCFRLIVGAHLNPLQTCILVEMAAWSVCLRRSHPHINNLNELVIRRSPFWFSSGRAFQPSDCRIRSLRGAAWQREEEAVRDKGGYRGPTCPPRRRPFAVLLGFPSLRFRIPHTHIYNSSHTPSAYYASAQRCGAMHPRCALSRSSPIPSPISL